MATKIGFEDIVRIFLFLLGASFQIAILVLMNRRKNPKSREIIFAFLSFAMLGWTFNIFISLFSRYLYLDDNIVKKICGGIAVVSFTLIFPLLLHTLLRFSNEKYLQLKNWINYILLFIFYIPIVLFWFFILDNNLHTEMLENNFHLENFISRFIFWGLPLLGISWFILIWGYAKTKDEEERRWLWILANISLSLMILYVVCFVFEIWKVYFIGPYLALFTEMLTFLLPPLLSYYLYFYNYMEYIFKRGLIFCVLGIAVITFYISLIRPLGSSMEQQFQINFRMIEGILVMLLVFFFDPLKQWLQEFFNWLFFAENKYYRKIFRELSIKISQVSYLDLETLVEEVARTISQAMKIKDISLILFEEVEGRRCIAESTIAIYPDDIHHLIKYLEKQRISVIDIYDFSEEDMDILREMRRIKAFTIIPAYSDNELIGLLNIGKRLIRNWLLAEEEEMLIMLVNQMVIAIENSRLVREKFVLERKMYENEKLSSLGRLSASIAHEVKNPLSSIKTIAEVTKEELTPTHPHYEGLELIVGEIDRLSRVVSQLLHFARSRSGKVERLIISNVIYDALLLLRHEAERNRVIIETQWEDKNIFVIMDKDALTEIFFNLIHNAIQALPQGGHIHINTAILYHSNKNLPMFIKICISDDGPGIPVADRQKIFEPFYTTKQTGTGLGLTIVLQRLQKLKGRIVVKDNAFGPHGTTFEVSLPVKQEDWKE